MVNIIPVWVHIKVPFMLSGEVLIFEKKNKSRTVPRLILEELVGQRFLEKESGLDNRFLYDLECLYGSW